MDIGVQAGVEGLYHDLWEKYESQPDYLKSDNDTELFSLLPTGKYAYIQDETYLKVRLHRLGNCDMAIMEKTFYPSLTAFVLQKGVVYRKYFDAT